MTSCINYNCDLFYMTSCINYDCDLYYITSCINYDCDLFYMLHVSTMIVIYQYLKREFGATWMHSFKFFTLLTFINFVYAIAYLLCRPTLVFN